MTIENDAKCAALAEAWQGSLSECKNWVVVVLGRNVGGGVIINGRLYKGSHSAAGEITYLLIDHWQGKGEPYHYLGHDGSTVGFVVLLNKLSICHLSVLMATKCLTGLTKAILPFVRCWMPIPIVWRCSSSICNHCLSLMSSQLEEVLALNRCYSSISKEIWYVEQHLPMYLVMAKVVRCQFMNEANLIGAPKNHLQYTGDDAAFATA